MTLYEVNQQAYSQLPTLSDIDVATATKSLISFLKYSGAKYYMLMSPDNKYYTVFLYKGEPHSKAMAEEIISVAQTLGDLKAIENEQDRMEFWVNNKDIGCFMLALFDYTNGVIEVE